MNKLKRSSRLVKSTAVKDPDLFLRHSKKYQLSFAINSQTQLTIKQYRQFGRGASTPDQTTSAAETGGGAFKPLQQV